MFPEGRSLLFGERHRIAGSRALTTEEWRPVVVEVAEVGRRWDRGRRRGDRLARSLGLGLCALGCGRLLVSPAPREG